MLEALSSSRTIGRATTGRLRLDGSIDVLCTCDRRAETTMTRVAGVSCFSFVKWSW